MPTVALTTCATHEADLALKQDKLKTCAGADLLGGTKINSCDEVDAKIAAATPVFANGTNTTKSGTGTSADPIKFNVAAASSTVVGVTRYATNEETRLGATDANKTTTAVTPDDLSYALQTGKDYPININSTAQTAATFTQSGSNGFRFAGRFIGNATGATTGVQAVRGDITGTVTASSSHALHGFSNCTVDTPYRNTAVDGTQDSTGTGTKEAVRGVAKGTGGTNIGVYGYATNGTTNWAGYFDGNVAAGPITTISDATLKENVAPIDPAKALQFRNGLRWVTYEMFTEQQEQINDAEGKPTGRYEVKRQSLGQKYGLIAQEIQALTEKVGAFGDVVSVVGEYFTLDKDGYPVKGDDGKPVVNKRYGLDYDAINVIILAAEQYDSSVTMRQARLALHQAGLLDKVQAAVDAADQATQIEWQFAQSVNRNYGLVTALAKTLGLTDKQLDDLFALARTL